MKMKAIAFGIVAMLLISGGIIVVDAGKPGPKPGTDFNGPHFNLNLIGKSKDMPGDYDNPDRHTMFVPIDTTGDEIALNQPNNLNETHLDGVKIEMTQGSEFAILDGDATDGYGSLQLGPGKYLVYIAVKAKDPKVEDAYTDITGWVEAYDNLGALWYYIPVGTVTLRKSNGWVDASDLFYVTINEDTLNFLIGNESGYDSKLGMWVFDYMTGLDTWYEDSGGLAPYDLSDLSYFWQFDNFGNKLIQVRFYKV